eukprot:Platyproteum_vivax@DN6187_c1_g1_i2.p1
MGKFSVFRITRKVAASSLLLASGAAMYECYDEKVSIVAFVPAVALKLVCVLPKFTPQTSSFSKDKIVIRLLDIVQQNELDSIRFHREAVKEISRQLLSSEGDILAMNRMHHYLRSVTYLEDKAKMSTYLVQEIYGGVAQSLKEFTEKDDAYTVVKDLSTSYVTCLITLGLLSTVRLSQLLLHLKDYRCEETRRRETEKLGKWKWRRETGDGPFPEILDKLKVDWVVPIPPKPKVPSAPQLTAEEQCNEDMEALMFFWIYWADSGPDKLIKKAFEPSFFTHPLSALRRKQETAMTLWRRPETARLEETGRQETALLATGPFSLLPKPIRMNGKLMKHVLKMIHRPPHPRLWTDVQRALFPAKKKNNNGWKYQVLGASAIFTGYLALMIIEDRATANPPSPAAQELSNVVAMASSGVSTLWSKVGSWLGFNQ